MRQMNLIKTFDGFDWDFFNSALQKFGYGGKFIHMNNVAFTKVQSKIKIIGLLPDPFTVMRGVR